ncbi:hypothetical protein CK203_004458 [Vitis vinifera]|uniref:Uncharacterized protein n=1 Tax=Vitis vinifera TaxID=29760 RepID=A0A438KG58_VITVI|nr:hypothetical protein CK203_004458 [Vitis vinifera]
MMEYILKIKNISDNLATIGEPINERDQILQLLGGLCAILASLTTREDNISFQSIHSILLTHEQRLCFQNTISPETDIISANMATAHHQNNNNKRINTIDNISQNKNSFAQRATHHLSQDVNTLFDVQPYSGTDQVTIGNGKKISILHTGSKILPSTFKNFHLQKVTKKVLLQGHLKNGLYKFPSTFVNPLVENPGLLRSHTLDHRKSANTFDLDVLGSILIDVGTEMMEISRVEARVLSLD